jgi:hypothetical protein
MVKYQKIEIHMFGLGFGIFKPQDKKMHHYIDFLVVLRFPKRSRVSCGRQAQNVVSWQHRYEAQRNRDEDRGRERKREE